MASRRELTAEEKSAASALRNLWETRRLKLGLTQEKAAFELGWKQQSAVSQYLNGQIPLNLETVLKFAKLLEVDPEMIYPRLVKETRYLLGSSTMLKVRENTVEGPEIKGEIPLISFVQAGNWINVEDPYAVGDAERWIPVTKRYSKRAYALRVTGDSMVDPSGYGPSFPPGCILCVEPETDPIPGAFVIMRTEGQMEATFKQLISDSGELYLKPLNPRYPLMVMPEDSVCVGVVKQMVMDF